MPEQEKDSNLFPMSEADRVRMRKELVEAESEWEAAREQRDGLKENAKEINDEMKKIRKRIVLLVNALKSGDD